jgi:hypothetical protein
MLGRKGEAMDLGDPPPPPSTLYIATDPDFSDFLACCRGKISKIYGKNPRSKKNRWEKVMADFLILAQLEGSNTTEMVKMTPKTTKSKIDPEKSYNQHLVPGKQMCALELRNFW